MTPLSRIKNFSLQTLKEFLELYTDNYYGDDLDKVYQFLESSQKGYRRSYYQIAEQFGIVFHDKDNKIFKFHIYLHQKNENELKLFLIFWFSIYYAPNYRMPDREKPMIFYCEILKILLNRKNIPISYRELINLLVITGNEDIFYNSLKEYGLFLNISKEKIKIEENSINKAIALKKFIETEFEIPILYRNGKNFYDRFCQRNFDKFIKFIEKLDFIYTEKDKIQPRNKYYQRIVYGAPGTGKSYSLNQEAKEIFNRKVVLENQPSKIISTIERVTFYDGYTYGQFVGMYKPTTLDNKNISYEYIPGPFMKQLIQAYKNPKDEFCLLIEEINRAKADKVFGNIFQLLDRNSQGESEYPILLSKEQSKFLEDNLDENSKEEKKVLVKLENEGLYLPNNLYIWATMNSADDNVQPLDTAFKRRWRFNYISLNANEDKFGDGETFIIGIYKDSNILWSQFRHSLNNILKINITEDRLIAPFFISPNDFIETDSNIKIIEKNILIEKVLMYTFDDLLRHYPKLKEKIFNDNIKTFSDIYEKITKNENFLELIFNEVFLSQMLDSEVTGGEELS